LDWGHFTIGTNTNHYLAVANNCDGYASHQIDSVLYQYNATTNRFVTVQTIPTKGALDWGHFTIGTSDYLAVANSYDGSSYQIDSALYQLQPL
jgi:hypothetical protein